MDISLVLQKMYPETEWVLVGAGYSGLEWLSESKKPTEKELQKKWPEVQAMLEAEQNAKGSAHAKLAALGLTAEEIAALTN